MKKIAAPGRRGSNAIKAFQGDELVDEIDLNTEAGRALAAERAAKTVKAEEEKIHQERAAAALVQAAAAAEAEEKRAQQLRDEEARRAAEEHRISEEQRRASAAQQAEMEAVRMREEEARRIARQQQQLEEQQRTARAKEELVRQQQEAAAAVAANEESLRLQALEEAATLAQEEAELAAALAEKARLAKLAKAEAEEEELRAFRKAAEEQRRKRELFLSDTDSFSTQLGESLAEKEARLKLEKEVGAAKLAEDLRRTSQQFVAPHIQTVPEVVEAPAILAPAPTLVPPVLAAEDAPTITAKVETAGPTIENFDKMTSSLFATSAIAVTLESQKTRSIQEEAPLSMPTRIGRSKEEAKKSSATTTVLEEEIVVERGKIPSARIETSDTVPAVMTVPKTLPADEERVDDAIDAPPPPPPPIAPPPVVPVEPASSLLSASAPSRPSLPVFFTGSSSVVPSTAYQTSDVEDVEVDGLEDFMTDTERTHLSATQREAWKAMREDLTDRRREFHGAVTYAFNGVFSWSMYGAAQAEDEYGSPYTEYLMRCQWGTTFDNMQPWIVAHRYSEFDTLNTEIRAAFPELTAVAGANSLPLLPAKDFFNNLDSAVISKRKEGLEMYFTKIATKIPQVLRSKLMENFLEIPLRVGAIRKKLAQEGILGTEEGEWFGAAPGTSSELIGEGRAAEDGGDVSDADFAFMTADQAEAEMQKLGSRPLDDAELGFMEEKINDLRQLMRRSTPKQVVTDPNVIKLGVYCKERWPRLRATMSFDAPDVSLIPRAMQVDEDLITALDEVKSTIAAYKMIQAAPEPPPGPPPPPPPPTSAPHPLSSLWG